MKGITWALLLSICFFLVASESQDDSTFGLFGVLFDTKYDPSGHNISYIEVDTITIDPNTGKSDSLYTNIIYPTPSSYGILMGVSAVDTKRNVLYFALDYTSGVIPSTQEIFGTDLVNKRAVSTIGVQLMLVTGLIYDDKNDRLLIGGFEQYPPTEDNSGVLISYSFTDFQVEEVYRWKSR